MQSLGVDVGRVSLMQDVRLTHLWAGQAGGGRHRKHKPYVANSKEWGLLGVGPCPTQPHGEWLPVESGPGPIQAHPSRDWLFLRKQMYFYFREFFSIIDGATLNMSQTKSPPPHPMLGQSVRPPNSIQRWKVLYFMWISPLKLFICSIYKYTCT